MYLAPDDFGLQLDVDKGLASGKTLWL
jgi:hypothetical protein